MIDQRDSALAGRGGRRLGRLISGQQLNNAGHDLLDATAWTLRLQRVPVPIADRQTPLQFPGQFEGSIGPFTAAGRDRFGGVGRGHGPDWRINLHHHACAAPTGARKP